MSRGPYPIMLMLAMALPGAVRALGLGEIRVDSALNEPLSAQIEIVGATRDELMALTAKVATREIFQRYGADRPAFLATATFKVGLDSQGHPVLNVRSGEAFTDPLVHFLVDLRWGQNDLIRDYSLLLDPAGFNSPRPADAAVLAAVAQALPPAPAAIAPAPAAIEQGSVATAVAITKTATPVSATAGAGSSAQSTPSATPLQHRITARDTLRGIARRSGARSESHVQRLMIAIFRANPDAFDGNINRLHRGAVLTLPTSAQLAAISATEAKREVRSQMTAWRLGGRQSTAPRDAASRPPPTPALAAGASFAAADGPAAAAAAKLTATGNASGESPPASLHSRVEFLEQALQDMHRQLALHNAKFRDLDAAPATARTAAPASLTDDAAQTESSADGGVTPVATAAPFSGSAFLGPIAAGVALLVASFAYARRRRPPFKPAVAIIEAPAPEPGMDPVLAAEEAAHSAHASNTETATTERNAPHDPEADFSADVGLAAEAALAANAGIAANAGLRVNAGLSVNASVAADTTMAAAPLPPRKTVSTPNPAAPPAPRASETAPRVGANAKSRRAQTTVVLEVDTEALERSYLDSLGIDPTTLDDTREHAVDTARLDAIADSTEATATHATVPSAHTKAAETNTANVDINNTAPLNTIDLEATVEHVQMPSGLNDRAVISERRANIIDALKMAIDRDPHRGDLRMKLLETYFTATLNSRRAFMDSVHKMARERDQVSAEDWLKVVAMGREIAADDLLFTDAPVDQPPGRLADCA